jgi:hypothetical protein
VCSLAFFSRGPTWKAQVKWGEKNYHKNLYTHFRPRKKKVLKFSLSHAPRDIWSRSHNTTSSHHRDMMWIHTLLLIAWNAKNIKNYNREFFRSESHGIVGVCCGPPFSCIWEWVVEPLCLPSCVIFCCCAFFFSFMKVSKRKRKKECVRERWKWRIHIPKKKLCV